ncbi:LuxR family transcriptional regulator [Micromonospora sp. NBC_01813]|uniref:LuxR family transcriptional regulator n=1 Tax=Micromonospora sp. NBC_01813 TaxID=2975988 RepID=UPI002DD97C56|nr:LuxR family transcriptional regulator [Micromonospora sp. NBC_01813]WSA10469.1 LuxR family transcriptional regulator [Micromonospora sp. NBC_01813]
MSAPPRYVLDTVADATTVTRRLTRDGWTPREGFALPDANWDVTTSRLALFGRVTDTDTVALVTLAAARGAAVVAICDPASDLCHALVDDLGRLGPVLRRSEVDPPTITDDTVLVPEQRALLERLANGETIAAAAAAEFLSLRTANRRIAQARAAYGVRTTREAVLAYLRQRQR